MNPNEETAFEARLQKLAQATRTPDPTPGWKAEILQQALAKAPRANAPRFLPPRWLMVGLAAAWMVIGILAFLTPGGVTNPTLISADKTDFSPPTSLTLVAFERHFKLYADLP